LYLLLSDQRRLAALKRLGTKKIPVLLLTQSRRYDIEDAKAASIVANLHRNKMNTKDIPAACVFLTQSIEKTKAAKSLGISSFTLKKYLGFVAVPDRLKQFVPKELSHDDYTKLYQSIPNVTKAVRIAEKIILLDQKLRKECLRMLSGIQSHLISKYSKGGLSNKGVGVTVSLNKANAMKLKSLVQEKRLRLRI